LLALCVALGTSSGKVIHAQTISVPMVDVLQRWMDAVQTHAPGADDEAVRYVRGLTMDQRKLMHAGLPFVMAAMAGERMVVDTPLERRLVDLVAHVMYTTSEQVFLTRAVIVHGDAAMMYTEPEIRPVPEGYVPNRPDSRFNDAPLLAEREMYIEGDGKVVGLTVADWQWGVARSLITRVRDHNFVSAWYHSTAAFMFRHRIFGEVRWHLPAAAKLLPNDPAILLNRGCAAEQEGLPRSQEVVSGGVPQITRDMGIRPRNAANIEAEAFFRRSISGDPNLFEARVRLSRLLNLRRRYADALKVITEAPPNTAPDQQAQYLAHLFAARAEQGLGRLDAAAARARQARALVPQARSAMMAASQIALLRADVPGAMDVMEDLAQLPHEPHLEADPWWIYETCTGRYAETLLAAMWHMVPR
jgi:tetratricopeptide (TPR) repeat protein